MIQPPAQVALIGLGLMGLPMALNLRKAGYAVRGADLSADARKAFTDAGGEAFADAREAARAQGSTGLVDLMGVKGLMAYVMASIITITGLDVIVVYLPLLGVERGIDAGTIGVLMTLRAVSSMAARLVYVPLIDWLGRMPLTYMTMLSPAVAFALVAAPIPAWLMYPLVIVLGVGLGISATLTLSGVVEVAPPNARGTAISLRLTGNRAGLVVIPFLAGLVATSTGVGGVFLIVSAILLGSTGGVWAGRRRADYAG